MSAVVVLQGLTKRFGDVVAVDELDLEVAQGEVLGFLGPNGAGKTTTIRLMLDILRPTSGSVQVLGGSPGDTAVRAGIGFLPAELDLDPRHTAEDVVRFLGSLRGGFPEGAARELYERFDLAPDRRIGQLSTGNRRKVGVVQAFAGRPELLVLDEPTAGLDPLLQHELLALVEERVAEGATVLLSSHVLPEVEQVADRIAILRRGRLVALGTVDDVRASARQRLELHLGSPADPAPFRGLPGVVEVIGQGDVLRIVVEGSVDAVVKQAAGLEVRRPRTERVRPRRQNVYVLSSIIRCALCDRRMQGAWAHGRAYYRCRFPAEYAQAQERHPGSVNVREEDVLPALDRWLAQLFAPEHVDGTCATLAAASAPDPTTEARLAGLRNRLKECDRKLTTYRNALEAGTDPVLVGQWIVELQGERHTVERELALAQPDRPQLTAADVAALVSRVGDIVEALQHAEPTDKADVYRELGISLLFQPGGIVHVESRPRVYSGVCPRGDLNPHALNGH